MEWRKQYCSEVEYLHSTSSVMSQFPVRSRPSWQSFSSYGAEPDKGLLVTHVNQTQDLLRLQGKEAPVSNLLTSEEWLQHYSLESMKLTIDDLLSKGTITVNPDNKNLNHIQFYPSILDDFESSVCETIELYHNRMRWLMEGSRKMFGLLKGTRVGIVVDTSDGNCGFGRLQDFQRRLLCLIDEQLSYKKQLYLLSVNTDISAPWQCARDINVRILHEARQWVQQLQPGGGCNLLKAMKKVLQMKELDSLVVIIGSSLDQTPEILSDYIEQCLLGRSIPLHMVTYDCSNHLTHNASKKLAEISGGRYHYYSSVNEDQSYANSDLWLLLAESQKAVDVLNKIKELREGMISEILANRMQEISSEVAKIPPTHFLPRPPNHDGPLGIEMPEFQAKTSEDWLKKNSLKAKKLSLYQVLAPNAFSLIEEFVPVLQRTVSSTLHEKAMLQFEWHDGTVKHLHVDPPSLYDYQKKLSQMVKVYEKRVDWLSSSSRTIWGTVTEKRVILLVDLSVTNSMYIIHIQHSLRLVLEQQMANKELFNIIGFGSETEEWQPQMVPPTAENLQDAWKWILTLQCKGSRNVMAALKKAIEVHFEDRDHKESQGIYLFTSGVPDQEKHAVSSFIAEICGGCDLQVHICLFSIKDFDFNGTVPARYATPSETAIILKEISHSGNGRFHWFRETGIIESDDIDIILSEMEKAANYSQKCYLLLESLKERSGKHKGNKHCLEKDLKMLVQKSSPQKLLPPKPTALTLSRMNAKEDQTEKSNSAVKALTWRPNSGKATIPPVQPFKAWVQNAGEKEIKQKKQPKTSFSLFYVDTQSNVGMVYKTYPSKKSVRISIPFAALPKDEEICSTKEWMKKYGLKKLKLDLHRLVSGPLCSHKKNLVQSLNKKVSAKYCTIFPSVEVNGVVRHLHFQPKEIEEYMEQIQRVLKRYIQRMQWLLSGSRCLFGTVLEKKVCILLDTSGSMDPYMSNVKKELTSLIWEQLRTNCISFSLITFSESVAMWQDCLVEASDEACHDAVQWLARVRTHGNTCTLEAIQKAFEFENIQGIYLLTDGKPDTSCSLVLKEADNLLKGRKVKIHTISFNCSDSTANEFLKKLAAQTGGRYHHCHGDVDGHFAAYRMLKEGFSSEDDPVLPAFEGDDLKRLAEEIDKARHFLRQARSFRSLLLERQMKSDQV
ncbi:von Willebrand factor A domain-containing protein 3A isoform X2 [Protopterus annectens]|uniref:von Willebrand factor A domain-containing protein 3A isoform X2 n=1 Tax=Protopterus annectens TaxID=7888 RepID=UPI001CFB8DF5|nr:von Willebrand factor A domain-containing protein 3A isoform X2 [Protopterus annectens]